MEQNPTSPSPNPASVAHEPRIATPVMDVVPPPVNPPAAAAQSAPAQQAPTALAMPPAEQGDDLSPSEVQAVAEQPHEAGAFMPGPIISKQSNGVAIAITMTVLIVIVLSGLAVFAYLQSK